ncbi:MAG: bifunctional glutamate N-acetyltransferase/amino-acid acetyltransferase ArgJ [Candidatus Omnitrophica bacterium]|nr:bifunctional glutamate N-acetyltransferase/amino-acid acetyltransferase ArgJ [Candidatus Omnitrophota bacterium]
MKRISGGITRPVGWLQSGIPAGIKKKGADMALIISRAPATACGVFTKNTFKAAPVMITKKHLRCGRHFGVIINSGNANCLTGAQGISDALSVLNKLALLADCKKEQLLVCSTGIIGKRLPLAKMQNAMDRLFLSLHSHDSKSAARAIMTTDTFEKERAYSIDIANKKVRLAGIAKGAGMISPDMATMIAVITTDADISKAVLKQALKESVEDSFNSITVDGDMSTNDTVLILANGLSGVTIKPSTPSYVKFVSALKLLCLDLARMIVSDAEGATKFIQIDVNSAKSAGQARAIGLKVANSPLFKTMCYGNNPNFGRIASACGSIGQSVKAGRVDIYINGVMAVKSGIACQSPLPKDLLAGKRIDIKIQLHSGRVCKRIYTSDLSPEYIRINAAYS